MYYVTIDENLGSSGRLFKSPFVAHLKTAPLSTAVCGLHFFSGSPAQSAGAASGPTEGWVCAGQWCPASRQASFFAAPVSAPLYRFPRL